MYRNRHVSFKETKSATIGGGRDYAREVVIYGCTGDDEVAESKPTLSGRWLSVGVVAACKQLLIVARNACEGGAADILLWHLLGHRQSGYSLKSISSR